MWPLHIIGALNRKIFRSSEAHEPHICIQINEWIGMGMEIRNFNCEHCGIFNLWWKVCQFVSPVCPAVSREVIVWQVANWSLQPLSWASLTCHQQPVNRLQGLPHIAADMKMKSRISFMKEVIINRNDNAPIYFWEMSTENILMKCKRQQQQNKLLSFSVFSSCM